MRKLLLLVFLISTGVSAQIVGKITDIHGESLSSVNIYLKDTYVGTASNDEGFYALAVPTSRKKQKYKISFQILGYKTLTKVVSTSSFPYNLNVVLEEEATSLEEVILDTKEDPAYRIIRKTIAHQKENRGKVSEYTADFYSRGVLMLNNIPEKIFGQNTRIFDGALDSTGTGIVYLSETISKIAFKNPDDFTEKIIASKVSMDDDGFSFNSAESSNFSFYDNTVVIQMALVSPIANNALNYYYYKLDGVFYDDTKLINKIKVIPRYPNDRVWEGYIYIVEDDWQLYGVDVSTNGAAIQSPLIKEMSIKQSYRFDVENDFWVKISQTIDFDLNLLKLEGNGRFIGVYTNYNFNPEFDKKTFTNEVISFEPEANNKSNSFWDTIRPVPLTNREFSDYKRRDSVRDIQESKFYLDSLDILNNKIKVLSPLTGYSYKNSYKMWKVNYDTFLPKINFNTVQGWNSSASLNFNKWYDKHHTKTFSASLIADYGLADERLRFVGNLTRVFNKVNKLEFSISGGNKVSQFNLSRPITPLVNTLASLILEKNDMKLYELNFGQIDYSQEVFNGLHLYGTLGFENRKPLFNTTDFVIFPSKKTNYTSNNPLELADFTNPVIEEHNMLKSKFRAKINFGQKYFSNPYLRLIVGEEKYPELNLFVTNGTSPTAKHYNFTQFEASLKQSVTLGNKGKLTYLLKGGGFDNGEGISFVDYRHFNGDETFLGTTITYIDVFNLLSYFGFSTNKPYFEGHLEHNFQGWVLGKIPGINRLNLNLVAGAHYLSTVENKPYTEFSIGLDNIGIGKFRMLRLDLVRSFYDGRSTSEIVVGLKFFEILGL